MPIDVTDKLVALLISFTDRQLEALPPAERRRLADQCRHLAERAEKTGKNGAKTGVLAALETRHTDE